MKLKTIWLIFLITGIIFVPAKIVSYFVSIPFVDSMTFFGIFLIGVSTLAFCTCIADLPLKNIKINYSNLVIGILSIILSFSFVWCISAYFNDTFTKYDFEWQPIMMSILSIFSFIAFILVGFTYISGKNLIAKAPFFIFCPILWFGLKMILFLSMNTNVTDPYPVITNAFMTLFALYHVQIFATSTRANNSKILMALGLPMIIFTLITSVPVLVKVFTENTFIEVSVATYSMNLLFAMYSFATLIEVYNQNVNFKVLNNVE